MRDVIIGIVETIRSRIMMNLITNHATTVRSQAPDVTIDLGRRSAGIVRSPEAKTPTITATTPTHALPERKSWISTTLIGMRTQRMATKCSSLATL